MASATYGLTIDKGSTFRQRFTWKADGTPVNLTGYTARMMIRTSEAQLLVELTTANGGVTLGGAAGTIDLYLSHTATAAITAAAGAYDLELTAPGGDVRRLLRGPVAFTAEVTYD